MGEIFHILEGANRNDATQILHVCSRAKHWLTYLGRNDG